MTGFADGTGHWCSLAARILGWRPADFWAATPAELAASLRDPEAPPATSAPSADVIAQMMERDKNG